jgi:hypothetical protein
VFFVSSLGLMTLQRPQLRFYALNTAHSTNAAFSYRLNAWSIW